MKIVKIYLILILAQIRHPRSKHEWVEFKDGNLITRIKLF